MASEQAWLNSTPGEHDPFAPQREHLEPKVGAVLQFVVGDGLPRNVVGYRWHLYEVNRLVPLWGTTYRLWREDDREQGLQVTQEVMDRCGRMLVGREEKNT